jgi:hypothetical protein
MIGCEFFWGGKIRMMCLQFWLIREQLKALLDSLKEWQRTCNFLGSYLAIQKKIANSGYVQNCVFFIFPKTVNMNCKNCPDTRRGFGVWFLILA